MILEVIAIEFLHNFSIFTHESFNDCDGGFTAHFLYFLKGLLKTAEGRSLVSPFGPAHECSPFCSPGRKHFFACDAAVFEAGFSTGGLSQTLFLLVDEGVDEMRGLYHQL